MIMDSFDAYKMYLGIKAHFDKGNYDFVKYGGKTKTTKEFDKIDKEEIILPKKKPVKWESPK